MKEGFSKKIELFANIAIIVVALILGFVLVKRFILNDSAPLPKQNIEIGSKVDLSMIDWAKNKNTLLLVLSKDCRYCTDSIPFYKKLNQETAQSEKVKLVAVFPQDVSTAKEYLQSHGLNLNDVHQVSVNDVGVQGTPTMLLINDKGEVAGTWFGKLFEPDENKVIERLKQL
jgi:thioredoxin-related protein